MKIVCTIGQAKFLKEIAKYNYNKDEAIAEITNNKKYFDKYSTYYRCIEIYFDECKTAKERKELINTLS